MLIYIFKSAACMAVFFVFYKLLLEKENMHVFKRCYLLLSLGAALLIPTLVFTEYVTVDPVPYTENQPPMPTNYDLIGVPEALEENVSDSAALLWGVYLIGFLFFGLRFIKNLAQIVRRIKRNPKKKSTAFVHVLLQENFPPHTFFKYIFLNRKKLESNEIPKAVLLHEETHAKQHHSWDVICIELLQVIFWFNPLIYLFKRAIKLNHEFLADEAVLNKNIDTSSYQNTLLSYLSPDSEHKYQSKMANAINYSSIKKRFTVMKTHTSKKAILLRSSLLLPLVVVLLFGFSETKLIEVSPLNTNEIKAKASSQELTSYNELAQKYNAVSIENRRIPLDDLEVLETIYKKMSTGQRANSQPFPECLPKNIQDGASRELMKEYNALAKKYNRMLSESTSIQIKSKDVERLEYIYGLMSDKQKADAEPFPDFPEPPAPPKAPKEPELTEREEAAKIIKKTIEEQDPYDVVGGNISYTQPPKAPKVKKGEKSDVPPSPPAAPEPIEPIDHVIEMAKKGATFYYEGEKVSADKAIELLKKDKDLNIQSTGSNSKKPTVKITKAPIYLDKSETPTSLETGNIEINGKEGFYSTKNGVTSYFDSKGKNVDRSGTLLAKSASKNPKIYFNGKQISSVKANQLLSNNKSIQMSSKDYNDGTYAILLTDLNSSWNKNINKNNNPNSAIDLTEMIEKDALFFYNDTPISTEKALWLTQNSFIERVSTITPKKGKPKVYFWDKV